MMPIYPTSHGFPPPPALVYTTKLIQKEEGEGEEGMERL